MCNCNYNYGLRTTDCSQTTDYLQITDQPQTTDCDYHRLPTADWALGARER
jgi:hypothetical protein